MAGPAAQAAPHVLSGEKVTIPVEMDREEKADLDEYVKHHPQLASTPGEALKKMAGLRGYRAMKQMTDPDRKKPSMLPQDAGVPSMIPCGLVESIDKLGEMVGRKMSYGDFLAFSARAANELGKRAKKGDESAKKALRALFYKISS